MDAQGLDEQPHLVTVGRCDGATSGDLDRLAGSPPRIAVHGARLAAWNEGTISAVGTIDEAFGNEGKTCLPRRRLERAGRRTDEMECRV